VSILGIGTEQKISFIRSANEIFRITIAVGFGIRKPNELWNKCQSYEYADAILNTAKVSQQSPMLTRDNGLGLPWLTPAIFGEQTGDCRSAAKK